MIYCLLQCGWDLRLGRKEEQERIKWLPFYKLLQCATFFTCSTTNAHMNPSEYSLECLTSELWLTQCAEGTSGGDGGLGSEI